MSRSPDHLPGASKMVATPLTAAQVKSLGGFLSFVGPEIVGNVALQAAPLLRWVLWQL